MPQAGSQRLAAELRSGMDDLHRALSSPSQGCSSASPCLPPTLKPSTIMAFSQLQALSWACGRTAPPARRDQGYPRLLHRAPSRLRTTALPGLGTPLLSLPANTSQQSASGLPGGERARYISRRSPSMPNPAPRNPGATASGSSPMKRYTLTRAVRLLSHPCGLALEPPCLFVGAFPSDEV